MDPTFVFANRIEAAFWIVIAIGFCIVAIRKQRVIRRNCIIAAVAFAFFGASDLVETTTGAWWRPWWLFAWKAACVAVFFWLLIQYARLRRM